MLEGLLCRTGFYSKCKLLIKQTRTRMEVVRRKRMATQKFMRKDIADLLANGLDTNAYGRAEGLLAELILSSCYDFIDHVCEVIFKHLPVLQKLRECPQDCREAVASVMFAAARFSDLPELRELRDVFQQRYGSSLEYYVNQKLVKNITPKMLSMEKKVQLMQDIASEFSIGWDSRSFEEKMLSSSVTEKNDEQQSPAIPHAAQEKVLRPFAEETVHKTVKGEVLAKKKTEARVTSEKKEREVIDMHQIQIGRVGSLGRRDDLKHNISTATDTIQKREEPKISFQRRGSRSEVCDSKENNNLEADIQARRMRKEDVTVGLKSNIRSVVPPPYVKPRKSKQKPDDMENALTFNPRSNSNRLYDKVQVKPENVDEQITEIYYRDDARSCDFTPRRRSHRRKNSRSIPIKDEHYKRDDAEEETVIEKLLLHYSKKSSLGNAERRSKSIQHKAVDVDVTEVEVEVEEDSTPATSRSFSLPSRHVTESETHNKVFVRASSFQPDGASARHVHPKLPNYDDFTARLAALRASQD